MKKIGIIGAPGVGKTTLTAGLFYQLKIKGYNVEWTPELIKYKVYQGVDFSKPGFDIQNTLEQLALEEGIEKADQNGHNLDFLICEAPLCNGFFYASFYEKNDECAVLKRIAMDKIESYDLIIFVVRSDDHDYVQVGRKETESQSDQLENHIRKSLIEINCQVRVVDIDKYEPLDRVIAEILF